MHYGDKESLKENELVLVVYKHEVLGEENKFDYELSSIQSCKYFPPRLLMKIIVSPDKYLAEFFADKKIEEWYLITLKSTDGYDDFELTSIENVSNTDNDFHRLH